MKKKFIKQKLKKKGCEEIASLEIKEVKENNFQKNDRFNFLKNFTRKLILQCLIFKLVLEEFVFLLQSKLKVSIFSFQNNANNFLNSLTYEEIISQLKCAEHLYAFVKEESNIPIQKSGLQQIKKCTAKIDWRAPAMLWRIAYLPDDTPDKLNVIPNFRVVGKRNGDQHFNSLDMAGYVGGRFKESYVFLKVFKFFSKKVVYFNVKKIGK